MCYYYNIYISSIDDNAYYAYLHIDDNADDDDAL